MTPDTPRTNRPDVLQPVPSCDVAVVGTGAVGLAIAIALARDGFDTVLIGPPAAVRSGRTVALLEGSVQLLDTLGIWHAAAAVAAPLVSMRIVDATGSLFRAPPVQFDAAELGRFAFGYNIENAALEAILAAAAARTGNLRLVGARAERFDFGATEARVQVAGQGPVTARLVVAADGRQSLARKAARIGVRVRAWPQTALTATFTHSVSHRNVSTEFHTRQGPFTLVPLPPSDDGRHRSSLVWVMDPAEACRRLALPSGVFARAAARQASALLGTMTLEGKIGSFPITTSTSARVTGPRLVLAGEAAHGLPPIGAQGLNLSFRDVAALTTDLATARQRGQDIGSTAVLDRYATARRGDVSWRTAAVDALNGSLLSRSPVVDVIRSGGLAALAAIGPLRRGVMRKGLVPGGKAVTPQALPPRLDDTEQHRRSTARF